jgi:hypothetical protein
VSKENVIIKRDVHNFNVNLESPILWANLEKSLVARKSIRHRRGG